MHAPAEKEGIISFLLCPGFTHASIARVVEAVGEGSSASVARGNPPSNLAAQSRMSEAGQLKK